MTVRAFRSWRPPDVTSASLDGARYLSPCGIESDETRLLGLPFEGALLGGHARTIVQKHVSQAHASGQEEADENGE